MIITLSTDMRRYKPIIVFDIYKNKLVLDGVCGGNLPFLSTEVDDDSVQKLKQFLSISDSEKLKKLTEFLEFLILNHIEHTKKNEDIGVSRWKIGYLAALNDMKKIMES